LQAQVRKAEQRIDHIELTFFGGELPEERYRRQLPQAEQLLRDAQAACAALEAEDAAPQEALVEQIAARVREISGSAGRPRILRAPLVVGAFTGSSHGPATCLIQVSY
jgi:hypothetical protein